MGCGSSVIIRSSRVNLSSSQIIHGKENAEATTKLNEGTNRATGTFYSISPYSENSGKDVSGCQPVINKLKIKELMTDDVPEILKQSRAAIEIQRVARGKSVRGSMGRRRSSVFAESKFSKSLNPHLSPAENASKALLDLAAVIHLSDCAQRADSNQVLQD